jgi:xylulokinase
VFPDVAVLTFGELDPDRLSIVQQSGVAAGELTDELTRVLGLGQPPLVVSGGHDQACAALGAGLTRAGLAMVSTGTAEVVEVALPSPKVLTTNDSLYRGNISLYAHVVPDLYLAMTLNQSGGLLLRWFRDTLCLDDLLAARHSGRDAYDLILASAPAGPTSLLVLPHFQGSGSPWFDTASKGAILGLTFGATKAEIAKALLEGLTFELRVNLDVLADGRVAIDELRAVGGGAKSDLWLQMKADVTAIPVVAPRVTDAAAWGAAMLAGVAAGAFASAAEAADRTVHFDRRFAPGTAAAAYAPRYQLYREVYPTLRDLNHRI